MTSTLDAPAVSRSRVSSWVHLPGLDGVRAIAVVAVLLFHADATWLPGGFLGVDVFFTLSGFLITSLLLAELDASGGLRFGRFYLRRARRLLPALFAMLVVTALLAIAFAQDAADRVREDAVASFFYVTNWWYVLHGQSYFEATGRPPMLQHLWSLAVEEQFYLVWPLLMYGLWRVGGRRAVQFGAIAGAVLSTVLMAVISLRTGAPDLADPSRIYFGTDTHAMTLLVGAALATVWSPGRVSATLTRRGSRAVTAVGLAGLVGLVTILAVVGPGSTALYRGGFLVVGLVTAMVIAGAGISSTIFARAMSRQPLTYLGQRSYGIYLWHWPIFLVLRPGIDLDADGWPVQLLRFALTLVVAEVSYRFLEMPVRNGALGRVWRGWRAAGTRTLVARGALVAGVSLAVVASLGVGLTAAAVPSLEDDLGGVTAVGDDPLVPTGPPAPLVSGSPAPDPVRQPPLRPPGVDAYGLSTTAMGDSVLLAARDAMVSTFPGVTVDAAVSRQSEEVFDRIRARLSAGKLGDVVIVATGTNGTVTTADLTEVLGQLSDRTRVVLVTPKAPRSWVDKNIVTIRNVAKNFPNTRVADWNSFARGHRDWFYADGIHTKGAGSSAYASLIRDSLRR